MSREDAETFEEYPPPPDDQCELFGVPLDFSLCEETWADGSLALLGYLAEGEPIRMWDRELPLRAMIRPKGLPPRVNPYAGDGQLVAWLENAPARAREAFQFFSAHTGQSNRYMEPEPVTDETPVDHAALSELMKLYVTLRTEQSPEVMLKNATDIYTRLGKLVQHTALPDRPLPQDNIYLHTLRFFCTAALPLQLHGQDNPQLLNALSEFRAAAEPVLCAHDPVGEIPEEYRDKLSMLNREDLLPYQVVGLREELWQASCLPMLHRVRVAFELYSILQYAMHELDQAVAQARERYGAVPHLKGWMPLLQRHLEEMAGGSFSAYLQAARQAWRDSGQEGESDLIPTEVQVGLIGSEEGEDTQGFLCFTHPASGHKVIRVQIGLDGKLPGTLTEG